MATSAREGQEAAVLRSKDLEPLLESLRSRGYRTFGPTIRDGAIVPAEIASAGELPVGWTDEQTGGSYRLQTSERKTFFGVTTGPLSWKRIFYPPQLLLWKALRKGQDVEIVEGEPAAGKLAVIGVRPCDLRAIAILDRVFLAGSFQDPHYRARREGAFLIAVNCTRPGGTCFCASLGTGPRAVEGFDLALTEIVEEEGHRFLAEAGSAAGREVLAELRAKPAAKKDREAAAALLAAAAGAMGRTLEAGGLKEALYANLEHPRWDAVADRCLTCGNCTLVCPTCFCSTMEDSTDLAGREAGRARRWDSCFAMDFSYIYGGHVRRTGRARYRQWLTHKLATWQDQFGTPGCVGCGRCITWCPVGIDLTEEVRALRGGTAGPA
jgi:sulfhydrogenase subunit beta (sulfur reductase)